MRFAVYSRLVKTADLPYTAILLDTFQKLGCEFVVFEDYLTQLKPVLRLPPVVGTFRNSDDIQQGGIDFFLTLGGDGTILDALAFVKNSGIPLAGVNLGRLGFLASIDKNSIPEAIGAMLQGNYILDPRTLLSLDSNFPLFDGLNVALNDFTILKRDNSSMIVVHTYLNGEFLNSYWADGVIVATPTGSTGYSLSCGGPIVFPNSGNFVITPVAPHNLTMRPLVIPDRAVLSFEIEGRGEHFLCTLDSRHEPITIQHRLAVHKADFTLNIVRLFERNFLATLREKLGWGIDSRN